MNYEHEQTHLWIMNMNRLVFAYGYEHTHFIGNYEYRRLYLHNPISLLYPNPHYANYGYCGIVLP